MQFTIFDGTVVSNNEIQEMVSMVVGDLKVFGYTSIVYLWAIEFLEWFLNKEIGLQKLNEYIILHEDIIEEELKQLEQLRDYLEL